MKLLLILISLFYSLQTFAADAVAPKSLVSVNGKGINELHFALFIKQLPQKPEKIDRNMQLSLMNELIKTRLLADAAEITKLDSDPVIEAALDIARMRVLAEAAIKKHLSAFPVKDEELKKLYDAKYSNEKITEYNASHILLNDEDEAKAVIKALKKGADFKKLAKEKSTDASSSNGGSLGWFSSKAVLKPFAEEVADLKKGKYSQTPVKSDFGWHVIKLDDIRVSEAPTYEAAKKQLTVLAQRQRLVAYVDQLQKTADITVVAPPVKNTKATDNNEEKNPADIE